MAQNYFINEVSEQCRLKYEEMIQGGQL